MWCMKCIIHPTFEDSSDRKLISGKTFVTGAVFIINYPCAIMKHSNNAKHFLPKQKWRRRIVKRYNSFGSKT